jgi:hypothetical protein
MVRSCFICNPGLRVATRVRNKHLPPSLLQHQNQKMEQRVLALLRLWVSHYRAVTYSITALLSPVQYCHIEPTDCAHGRDHPVCSHSSLCRALLRCRSPHYTAISVRHVSNEQLWLLFPSITFSSLSSPASTGLLQEKRKRASRLPDRGLC